MGYIDNTIRKRIIELCSEKISSNEKGVYESVAKIIQDEFNEYLSSESIRGVMRRHRKAGNYSSNMKSAKVRIMADGLRTSERDIELNENTTPDELIAKHGFDPTKFELVSSSNSKWENGNSNLSSSKITIKPVKNSVFSADFIEKIFDNITVRTPSVSRKSKDINYGQALVIPMADLHYGERTGSISTGNEHNCENSINGYWQIINDIIDRVSDIHFKQIYFTIGGDMLNCDNKQGTTTRGTHQDNDGDIEQFIIDMTNNILSTVELLRTIAPVHIIYIPGNHDELVSFGIANVLRVYYKFFEDVTVDYSQIPRKYATFGNTLLGFAHKLNTKNINNVLQMDVREEIGKTTNTVYFLQHYHREFAIDEGGTDIRMLPTISPLSRWAFGEGFVSRQKCQSFIIDEKYGITDVMYSFLE